MRLSRILLALAGALVIPASAFAVPPDEYLKIRNQNRPDLRLSYPTVKQSPADYAGKVLELRGTVDGYVRRDSDLGFMLTMEDKQAVMLTATMADEIMIASPNKQRLRVLAKVADSVNSNVAEMRALAVASDAELNILERELAAGSAPAPAVNRKGKRPAVITGSRGITPSRSGATLTSMGVSALASRVLSPEAQAIMSREGLVRVR